jgi:DNA-directed RNA polymerase alpha subunit
MSAEKPVKKQRKNYPAIARAERQRRKDAIVAMHAGMSLQDAAAKFNVEEHWLASDFESKSPFLFNLPSRAANSLKNELWTKERPIITPEMVASLSKRGLLRTPNFGRSSLKAIERELAKRGLSLKE